ncbi:MAG: hypothetical protein LC667_02935, partial [Thioalkalivibrio sp.]|nr:hypothetical protein [Thioalkalivibrio sp.]
CVPIVAGSVVALVSAAKLVASGAWPNFFEATFLTIFASQVDAFNQPLPPVFDAHPAGGLFLFLYGPGAMFGAMMRGDPVATPGLISWAIRVGYGSAYLALALVPLLAVGPAQRNPDPGVRVAARVVLPFSAMIFLGIFPSTVWSHLAAVYPPLLVVLAAAFSYLMGEMRRLGRAATVVAGGLVLIGLAGPVALAARLELEIHAAFEEPLGLPAATL